MKLINASLAFPRMTPLPAITKGNLAFIIISEASFMRSSGASGGCVLWTLSGSPSASILAMFSGKSTKQPPGFSVVATSNALRKISGTTSGERMPTLYFEIGANTFTKSKI